MLQLMVVYFGPYYLFGMRSRQQLPPVGYLYRFCD